MIVEELKKSILKYAISGKLSKTEKDDSSVDEMIVRIYNEREKQIKCRIAKNDKYKTINEELKFDIPNNWRWIRIGEIGNWGSGATPERGILEYYKNGTISWLKTGELNDNYVSDSEEKITEIALNKCSLKINKPGDILIAMYGATIGKLGIATVETTTNQACCGCTIYSDVNNKYLFYYLMEIRNKLISMGEGSGQPNISREKIINLPFPLPPIEEQQRIVDKTEQLFAKLDEIKPIEKELIHIKEIFPIEMKNSILKEAFDGKYSLNNNWQNDKLSNVCNEICTGNSISESIKKNKYTNIESGYNYIGTKDLNFNHIFNYENGVKIPFDEPNFKYANIGDILLCIEGGSAGKKIGILTEKVCYGNKLCKFSSTKLNSKFLYYYLQSPQFTRNFYDNLSGIIGGVSINKIRSIEISFPSLEEQQKIVNKIEQLLQLCDDIEQLIKES